MIFAVLSDYQSPIPEDAPKPLVDFFVSTRLVRDEILPELDVERLQRGTRLFRTYASQACVVMLASSLPSGYSAPCLAQILTISDQLRRHPYRRLLGVLQLLVNISQPLDDDLDNSAALVTAQKLRLLHAGVRSIVGRKLPAYEMAHGSPVNHEDMMATIMGFSLLVVEGWRTLGVDLDEGEVEDYWYCWRQFSRMMGIYPHGQPLSEEFIPQSYAEAAAFYRSYVRRQFENDPAENPEGKALTEHNLQMMQDLIPGWLRYLGFSKAPHIAMEALLGPVGLQRVGMASTLGSGFLRSFFDGLLRLVLRGEKRYPDFFGRLGRIILQGMIREEMGGRVSFLIPMNVEDMKELSKPDGVAVSQSKELADVLGRIVVHEAPLPGTSMSSDARPQPANPLSVRPPIL